MDCRTVQWLLPFYRLAGEMPAADADAVRRHLEGCPVCRQAEADERAVDGAIGRAMRDVVVPADLRDRVGTVLARQRGRLIQRRAAQSAAIAIALLLVVSVTLVRWSSRITLHPGQLVQEEDQSFVLTFNRNQDSAAEFFRAHDLRTRLPDDVDYGYLASLEVASFRRHRVARLDFRNGEARMKVYVLPRREFRLPRGSAEDAAGSHATVEVVEGPGDYLYVYICFDQATRQMFQPRAVVG